MGPRAIALCLAAVAASMLAGAFAFEHIGRMPPCVLCWWQRYAWFAALALALAATAAPAGAPRTGLVALAGLAALTGAGIAGFHVGVEQRWWEGTAECGGIASGLTAEERLKRILEAPVVRCTDIPWSMLGISMAGWNGLIAAAAGLATLGAVLRDRAGVRR
ncbi:MAG: disulfide bond formation protein B [Alphaproteobacteria bacterium]|nr:disulfide bond formation protein B [Alphaproteobacteria bacterium]